MPVIHVATGLAISLVMAWSGVAKLKAPQSMAEAMRALRVPTVLAGRPMQIAVPWLELVLAAGLLVTSRGWQTLAWGATLLLFAAYLAVIVRAVALDEKVSCNCFGAASAPVDRGTVARNILLVAASAIGLFTAQSSPTSLLTRMVGMRWESWLALFTIAVLAGLAWFLAREQATSGAAQASAGVPSSPVQATTGGTASEQEPGDLDDYVRAPIPVAVLERQPGEFVLLPDLARERGVALFYVSVTCGSCTQILEGMDDYVSRLSILDVVVVVSSRDAVALLPESVQPRTLVDVAGSVQEGLHLGWVPGAVLLGADGLLAGGPVFGADPISQLVDDVVQELELARSEQPADETPVGA